MRRTQTSIADRGRQTGGARTSNSGFTLIEILVVVAIIGIAMAVLTPALFQMLRGRSLRSSRNSLAAYFDRVRSEAVNANCDVLLVVLPDDEAGGKSYKISAKAGDTVTEVRADPGIVAFYVRRNAGKNSQARAAGSATAPEGKPWERIEYMNRDFSFLDQLNGDVRIHPGAVARAKSMGWTRLGDAALEDIRAVIPEAEAAGATLIHIRADGRAQMQLDVPGYLVDRGITEHLDGDLILHDGTSIYFFDLSPMLRLRGQFVDYDLLPEKSPWRR